MVTFLQQSWILYSTTSATSKKSGILFSLFLFFSLPFFSKSSSLLYPLSQQLPAPFFTAPFLHFPISSSSFQFASPVHLIPFYTNIFSSNSSFRTAFPQSMLVADDEKAVRQRSLEWSLVVFLLLDVEGAAIKLALPASTAQRTSLTVVSSSQWLLSY